METTHSVAACAKAPVIWLALEEIAFETGSGEVKTTHAELTKRTGVRRRNTIYAALQTLEKCGWIERWTERGRAKGRLRALSCVRLLRGSAKMGRSTQKQSLKSPKQLETEALDDKAPPASDGF